jgi:uncharacterized MAPEG superfamily protein
MLATESNIPPPKKGAHFALSDCTMTTEIFWLTLTTMLASSLWIPFVIGVNVTTYEGKSDGFHRPPDPAKMAPWVHRSYRAHLNLLEQFLPFAIVVLIAHTLHVSTPITIWCTGLFFWIRVAHAIGMISGKAKSPLRPILFTSGWLVTMTMFWQVLSRG